MSQSTTLFINKSAHDLDVELCAMIHKQSLSIVSVTRVSEFTIPEVSTLIGGDREDHYADYLVVYEQGFKFDPPIVGYQG